MNVDHGSFTPLVFSSTGSAGPMADTFLQRLAGKLSEKDGVSYSSTIAWLRCRFSFALLVGHSVYSWKPLSQKVSNTPFRARAGNRRKQTGLALRPTQNMES